jgi:uncharacterized protein YjgD (DUF1641 family)
VELNMSTSTTDAGVAGTANASDVAEQLAKINEKLDRLSLIGDDVGRRMERFDDLKEDLVPIAHGALKIAYRKLHELEQKGALDFVAESGQVAMKIATSFTREDVKLLGVNVVKILQTVRNLTQPEVLDVADRAAAALQEADAESSKMGLFKAMRDPEVRRGMTLLLAVLRELGSGGKNGKDKEGSGPLAAE